MHCNNLQRMTGRLLAVLAACSLLIGCSGYDGISPTGYEYAKALYSISNRQADYQLDAVASQIQVARDRGELPDKEAAWFDDIIAKAREGQWQVANQESRRIMEDQIN